jgi:hypothetical protein
MTNQITQKFIDLLGPITDGKSHFSKYAQENVAGGHTVCEMSKVQLQLAEQLIKDHFKVKKVLWMELPSGLTEDGKEPIVAKTYKLVDEDYETYEGKTAYVYQILFSPKMYDPTSFMKQPVKDGCTFGPLMYNPETFEPSRHIILTFNPTFPQDIDNTEDQTEVMKQSLRDKLEKVLDNPEDYMPEGFRACMIRMAVK